jgi:hypothetical protein
MHRSYPRTVNGWLTVEAYVICDPVLKHQLRLLKRHRSSTHFGGKLLIVHVRKIEKAEISRFRRGYNANWDTAETFSGSVP